MSIRGAAGSLVLDNTGTEPARSARRARLLAWVARRLFVAAPMPDLKEPVDLSKEPRATRIELRVMS